ncbi:MAG: hypothetical protein EPO51_25935 [Phenylobacterium sp.]|uniref:hypothetical protein n=1 Tax=Phenylobacterium sp. TaxID=1871053 RepID=UPI00120DA8A1|nr:hypothetical protein [Phenylobacterium sp.]TAJ68966.1 MAG: hypothetical protein EPO51_25935 [Phenylobacterium sp.]
MQIIEVAPLGSGWRVSLPALAGDMVFARGGAAESTARRLAARLAGHGLGSELRIRLRDGSLAARLVWPAHADPGPVAAPEVAVAA